MARSNYPGRVVNFSQWLRTLAPDNKTEIAALEADAGRHIGYIRVAGRRRADAPVFAPIESIPAHYAKQPLLRV